MTKRQIKSFQQFIYILFMFTGLIINYIYFNFNIIGVFVVLILSTIISGIIGFFLPVKNKKRKKHNQTKPKQKSKNTKKTPHNRQHPDDEILKLPIEQLSWREFERLFYLYYKEKGNNPRETKEGADGGVDLIIYDRKENNCTAIQIKHVKRQITVEDIRQLSTARRNYSCLYAKFITSSRFTNDALLQADKFKVETRDRTWIKNNVDRWRFK